MKRLICAAMNRDSRAFNPLNVSGVDNMRLRSAGVGGEFVVDALNGNCRCGGGREKIGAARGVAGFDSIFDVLLQPVLAGRNLAGVAEGVRARCIVTASSTVCRSAVV